ncbi:MAG: glycosyltransferase family 1 protein [Pseudomonadota bacterium]|nr:glycosyltransferase family 1 protein [Pseudomonadota bacterium]
MRILLVSDAWLPQVNGVVRTLTHLRRELEALGHTVHFITAEGRRSWPMPFYREIRLAFVRPSSMGREIDRFAPDAIHIATEGPLGISARAWCVKKGLPFTTAFHTRYPEFARSMFALPGLGPLLYALLRRFHRPAACTMVPTPSIREALTAAGFTNLKLWSRGVDHDLFQPYGKEALDLPRPIFLCSGRVAAEKGLEAFLTLDLPGSKVIVGDGPERPRLQKAFPGVAFTGFLHNGAYARTLAAADVFVFPSRYDTFGLVMLEAMACGVPVAAYPVPGPIDVVEDGATGALHEDLRAAALRALTVDGRSCRQYALTFTWRQVAEVFATLLVPSGLKSGAASDR